MIDREIAPIWHDRFARLILRNLPLKSGQFALDLHSGPGRLATEVLQRLDPTSRVLAIEPDDTLIELAKSRVRAEWRNRVYYKSGDFSDIFQMAAASYDLVMGNLVLGEGTELAPAVGELLRVTKPGGHVLATLPLQGTWQEVEDIFAEVLRDAGLKHAVRRLERLRSLRPPASLLGDLLREMNCPEDNYVIESEQLQMIFPSGREFLFAPVIEHGPLRLWKAIIGDEGSPQELFWRLKEAIDVYYSGQVLAVTVVAGLIHVQIPDPHDTEPSLAAQYWSRYPELDRLWGGLAGNMTGQGLGFAFSDEDVDEFDLDLDIDIDDGFDEEPEPEPEPEAYVEPEPEPAVNDEAWEDEAAYEDERAALAGSEDASVYDAPTPSYDHYAGAPDYEESDYTAPSYDAPEPDAAAAVAEGDAEEDDDFDDAESSFAGLADDFVDDGDDDDDDDEAGSSIAAAIEDELSGGLLEATPGQADFDDGTGFDEAAFDEALSEDGGDEDEGDEEQGSPEAPGSEADAAGLEGVEVPAHSDDEPAEAGPSQELLGEEDGAAAEELPEPVEADHASVETSEAVAEADGAAAEADGAADEAAAEADGAAAEADEAAAEADEAAAEADGAAAEADGAAAEAEDESDAAEAAEGGAEADAEDAGAADEAEVEDGTAEASDDSGSEGDDGSAADGDEEAQDGAIAAKPLRGLRPGGLPLKLGARAERPASFRAPSFTPPPPTPALTDKDADAAADAVSEESAEESGDGAGEDAGSVAAEAEAKPRLPGLPGLPGLPAFRAPSSTPVPASDSDSEDAEDEDEEVLELDDELLEVDDFEELEEEEEVTRRPPPPPKPPPPPPKPLKPRPLLPIPFGAPKKPKKPNN